MNSTRPAGSDTRHSTDAPSLSPERRSRGAKVPVVLSSARPARSHRSSTWTSGFAYRYTGRKMPLNRKKSWSSSQPALLRLCTSTQSRLSFGRMASVRSKWAGVKESSL